MNSSALLEQPGGELSRTPAEVLVFDEATFAELVSVLDGADPLFVETINHTASYKGSQATDASNQIKVLD